MAKKLVIVESPAKAKAINKYLGTSYKVEASMGHIRDLPRSRFGVDIENQFSPQYIIMSAKKKTVSQLKKMAKGMEHIYLAADPDREGEAICWHLEWILSQGYKGEIQRVAFNEITPAAVREAFSHPRPIDTNLVNAQQARRILDRIVGYKLSPLLWKKVARGLSAGRVQSVALKLITDREREIRAFKPEEYWALEAILSPASGQETGKRFSARLDKIRGEKAALGTRDSVDTILRDLQTAMYTVVAVDEKQKRRKAQPPFITSKLQQEAYTKLRFPAQKTMQIAQRLYEGVDLGDEGVVGLITYMRTDSVTVSATALTDVRSYIKKTYGNDYLPEQPNVFKARKRAQEAHEAIRPTAVERTPDSLKSFLSDDEFKLYSLIWKRFVSSQMTEAEDAVVSVDIEAAQIYLFRAVSTRTVFAGFTIVYTETAGEGEETNDESAVSGELPHLAQGDTCSLCELVPSQHFTKPPARFNDASLVKILEELGIGRPSTYAPTLQTILARGYVERRSGALHPTEMGELVIDLLVKHFSSLIDVAFTAHLEDELDEVEEGTKEWTTLLDEFYGKFSVQLTEAQVNMSDMKSSAEVTDYICDICGRNMVIKWGRFGKFLACPGFPECKYTKSIPTGYRCPIEGCGGELVRRQSKTKRVFYGCSRYPKCTYTIQRLPSAPTVSAPLSDAPDDGSAGTPTDVDQTT